MTLPLGPMTSPILSIGISMETIFGALLATSVAGLGDGTGHDVEDGEAGLLGLVQRLGQHVGRQAVDLGVELEGGHASAVPATLKSMSPKASSEPQDVGQGDVGAPS
jgi:hypothetical protein